MLVATADTVAINKGTFRIFLPSLRKGELPIETSVQPWYIPHSIPATSSQNDSSVFKNSFFFFYSLTFWGEKCCIVFYEFIWSFRITAQADWTIWIGNLRPESNLAVWFNKKIHGNNWLKYVGGKSIKYGADSPSRFSFNSEDHCYCQSLL